MAEWHRSWATDCSHYHVVLPFSARLLQLVLLEGRLDVTVGAHVLQTYLSKESEWTWHHVAEIHGKSHPSTPIPSPATATWIMLMDVDDPNAQTLGNMDSHQTNDFDPRGVDRDAEQQDHVSQTCVHLLGEKRADKFYRK
jgi:hypothetical protein